MPKKMLGKVAPKAKEILKDGDKFDHEFKTMPLVGIFNIKTNTIYLYPCLKERVWFQIDADTGKVTKAWHQEKDWRGNLIKGAEIKDEIKIASYNDNVFAPRAISIGNAPYEAKITSHMFLVNIIDEVENKKNYRGFSIIPSKNEPGTFDYIFDSASLNKTTVFSSKIMDQKNQRVVIEELQKRFSPSSNTRLTLKPLKSSAKIVEIELEDVNKFKNAKK